MEWIIVAFGGGVGALLRYLVQQLIVQTKISSYWATATVNIIGSFLLGIATHRGVDSSTLLAFLTVGVLGGFTTFSTFAVDIVKLVESKKWCMAVIFIGVNLIGGILAFSAGWII